MNFIGDSNINSRSAQYHTSPKSKPRTNTWYYKNANSAGPSTHGRIYTEVNAIPFTEGNLVAFK